MAEGAAPGGRLVRSVRFRVTAIATLLVTAVLVLTAYSLLTAQRRVLTQQLDESLASATRSLDESIEAGEIPTVFAGFGDDDSVVQIVDLASAEVVAATPNVRGEPPLAWGLDRDAGFQTADDLPHDDASFRLLARTAETPDRSYQVLVAASLDDINESVAVLRASLAIAVPVVVALLAALVWWLVGRTLRPVDAIRSEVAEISGTDLHRRVPEPGTGDEVDRLAHTMNAMLDRVEDASQRQQQFVADASHELRSPLTRMRSELEVDLAHPDGADLAATHRSVLDETIGLQRLVDDLLLLARSGEAAPPPRRDPVDLDDVVLRIAHGLHTDDGIVIDAGGVTAAQVLGDANQLARAVTNVLENGARHASARVTITLHEAGDHAELAVADDGPGIAPEDRERVFERFARLDDARTRANGGAGLGLAITREIVERHGGTIRLDGAPGGGTTVVIQLPLPPPGPEV